MPLYILFVEDVFCSPQAFFVWHWRQQIRADEGDESWLSGGLGRA